MFDISFRCDPVYHEDTARYLIREHVANEKEERNQGALGTVKGRRCWRGVFAGSQLTEQTPVDSKESNESPHCTESEQWLTRCKGVQMSSVWNLHLVKEKHKQ